MDTLLIIFAPPSAHVQDALSREGFGCTELTARGGFSRKKIAVLYVGVAQSDKERVLKIVKETSSSQKEVISGFTNADDALVDQALVSAISTTSARVGGATVFELPISNSYKF